MDRPRNRCEHARTLLTRCVVRNSTGTTSIRYTEYQAFELWAHLLQTRHRITVCKATPCIWLPEREFESRRSLLDRSYEMQGVTCVEVAAYNPETRITEHKTRYIATVDWPVVGELVQAHLETPGAECSTVLHPGVALATSRTAATSRAA